VNFRVSRDVIHDDRLARFDDFAGHQFIYKKTNFLHSLLGGGIVIGRAPQKKFLPLFIKQDNHAAFSAHQILDHPADIIQQFIKLRILRQRHTDPQQGFVASGDLFDPGDIP